MPTPRPGAALTVALAAAALAATAVAAPVPLPTSGQRVDSDPAHGIPTAGSAGASDVVGGALTAGAKPVPWATFEKAVSGHSQIFVRSFTGGKFVTQGNPASLNLNTQVDAEAPSIDFAGADRTVPWTTWYEPSPALGNVKQIIASHFDATNNKWIPAGQDRGSGVPSLNINTGREAEDPSVAGGATTAGNPPVPWVAWKEADGPGSSPTQIFVSRAIKTTDPTCPVGTVPTGGAVIGGFCWQEVGVARISQDSFKPVTATDATLNIDPTRLGEAADIAFTGPNDTVPWVVWYEEGTSGLGLRGNELVFAAKGVADGTAVGGFAWKVEGARTGGQGVFPLDRSGANQVGRCGDSVASEDLCSMNISPDGSAVDPRVAAGTLTAGTPTVPWVVWIESAAGGKHGVFVSRLVGGDHFEAMNGGRAVSPAGQDAGGADITFAGHTPVVTWNAKVKGVGRAFTGHFTTDGAFVLDTPQGIQRSRAGVTAQRIPVSSDCTADPFSADGNTCRGGGTGTAFLLFTDGGKNARGLFAESLPPTNNAKPRVTVVSWPRSKAGARTITGVLKVSEPGILTVTARRGGRSSTTVVDVAQAGRVKVTLTGLAKISGPGARYRIQMRDELGATTLLNR
ncbi:MAG: hypothetical protein U0Y82_06285 [Thermoleophilia bacterium]